MNQITGPPLARRNAVVAPGLPAFVRGLIDERIGDVPFSIYQAESNGGLVSIASSGLMLESRDPWTLELETSRLWEQAHAERLIGLFELPRRAGLAAPEGSLYVRPIHSRGELSGGLLLRISGRGLIPDLSSRVNDPTLIGALGLLLDLGRAQGENHALNTFREAVGAALPYGILGIDPLGRITYAGGRASSILGLSEVEMVGSDCARVFRPIGAEMNPLVQALRRRLEPIELYVARPDGGEIPVLLQTAPSPQRSGRPRSVVAFFQDLSEERALEEAERQRDRLAVIGELSAGVAHEIRNPLTGIANCAQVLAEGFDPEDSRQRFTRIILDEAARLNRIVEGLLHYARPNRPELREAPVEESVRRAVELVRSGLEAKGIRITLRVSGRIPRIFLDGSQIEQVLLNLFRNSEEAMPSGGEIKIEISVIRRSPYRRRIPGRRSDDRGTRLAGPGPSQRFVQVKVADTGHGIPKDLLPRVSNPFFTTRTRGTGLGLSLAQSIMRGHGGILTVRSVVGKGTTVQLDLPVERRQGDRRKESR